MAEPGPTMLAAARRGLFQLYREQNATVWIEATGVSMLPSIRSGMWLLVEFGPPELAVGEIALFARGDTIVAHRIVRRHRGGDVVVCKGDARLEFDRPVPVGDVLGVVRGVRRSRDGATETAGCSGPRAVRLARLSAGVGDAVIRARRLPALLRRPVLKVIRASMRVAFAWSLGRAQTRR